ncbi:unnamed protein product [Closterium sp. Yama58-4]|nr:unnamed protein product [Closterium sp. Yama58-4]
MVTVAEKYPLCPFTGLPPTKPKVKASRCLDAAEMSCCKDCSDRRYALAEVSANVTTLISTVDPRLSNLLGGKDIQLCSSFVNFRECQDLLEQMICATGCNPDSGKYLELPRGVVGEMRVCAPFADKVYEKCKDLPLPGFQGAISQYFNSGEKLMTTLFGRVGQAFDAINYTVVVTPVLEGTDKCYNGPTKLPDTNVCCDSLPATKECPISTLNVTMHPEYKPFIGRTIADPSCPAAPGAPSGAGGSANGSTNGSGSGSANSSATGSSSPPPPKESGRLVTASRGVFSVFVLAAAAGLALF